MRSQLVTADKLGVAIELRYKRAKTTARKTVMSPGVAVMLNTADRSSSISKARSPESRACSILPKTLISVNKYQLLEFYVNIYMY